MKKSGILVVLLHLCLAPTLFAAGGILPGSGTSSNPYLIEDFDDFQAFCDDETKWAIGVHTKLMCDIDLAGIIYTKAPIAFDTYSAMYEDFDGTPYSGIFDGQGHSISGLTIYVPGTGNDYLALFGYADENADISYLNIVNCSVTGGAYYSSCIAGLCGCNKGTITNCTANGTLSGVADKSNFMGLLCGENDTGIISGSSASGTVSGYQNLGGLCGYNNDGTVTNCHASGSVSGSRYIGGLCGKNYYGTISNSYATGLIGGDDQIGGLCGYNGYGTIYNCYALGNTTGDSTVGGFCGYNSNGIISDCYSIGVAAGNSNFAGFCGYQSGDSAEMTYCFWDIETSGLTNGYNLGSTPGTVTSVLGKTTAEMQVKTTYVSAGWDFIGESENGTDEIWFMDGYPDLVYFNHDLWSEIPDLSSLTQSEAESLILLSGFYVGTISMLNSDLVPAGIVFDQSPPPSATEYAPGYSIDFTVSIGPYPIVPQLTGLTLVEAEAAILNAGLTVGGISYQWNDSVPEYQILNQTPTSGSVVPSETSVNLTISLGNIVPLKGSGTYSDPFLIESIKDFEVFSDPDSHDVDYWAAGVHTKLMCNINLDGRIYTIAPIAFDTYTAMYEDFDGTPYSGIFDGQNYTISNLTIYAPNTGHDYLALFGYADENADISNLNIVNCSVTGGAYYSSCIAGLCGCNKGTITNCKIYGTLSGVTDKSNYMGLLCGLNDTGIISYSSASGTVSGDENLGGLCGYNNDGTITNCHASGSVLEGDYAGGLCGKNSYGTISNSYATSSVSGGNYIGCLCGYNSYGTINNSYATGSVMGRTDNGGLCGRNFYGTISNCYATGPVSGIYSSGGLCGSNYYGTISNCYALGDATGDSKVGSFCGYNDNSIISACYSIGIAAGNSNFAGFCGYQSGSSAIISDSFWDIETSDMLIGVNQNLSYPGTVTNLQGLSTSEMQNMDNFLNAGWDFLGEFANGTEDIWFMDGYPFLYWIDQSDWLLAPYLLDLSETDAIDLINQVGFSVGDITYEYNDYATYGNVISQNPLPDSLLPPLFSIDLVVSLGPWPRVPDVVNMTQADAEVAIVNAGFAVGDITFSYDDIVPFDYVISTSPVTGTPLDHGSEVSLVVSLGVMPRVPDVVNMTQADAEVAIVNAGFAVGDITFSYDDIVPFDYVISTSPVAGTPLDHGSEVSLVVSLGVMPKVPNLDSMNRSEAQAAVIDAGLSVGDIALDWDDLVPVGMVSSQNPAPGTAVMLGTPVDFTISLGKYEPLPGSGTASDPYLILDFSDFIVFSDNNLPGFDYWDLGVHTALICDINLDGWLFSRTPVSWYAGVFDGNGHSISNLQITVAMDYLGLFSQTGKSAVISDLNCLNFNISGNHYIGGICGYNMGTINNCSITGSVSGSWAIGGLCGIHETGSISNSSSSCSVTGDSKVGGLCGYCYDGSISGSYADGNVSATINIGGLCGDSMYGEINNCYALGYVSGDKYVGGLCGKNSFGTISNCFSAGGVSGNDKVAGLCGYHYGQNAVLSNCFWDTVTSGMDIGCCFGNSSGTVTNLIGKTSDQLQDINTFLNANWDFVGESANGTEDLWHMPYQTTGYPMLFFQRDIPGDHTGSYGVNLEDFGYLSNSWLEDYNIADLETLALYWLEQ